MQYDKRLLTPGKKIYLDLDGCVLDFISGIHKYLNLDISIADVEVWINRNRGMVDRLPIDFWATLDFLPNGKKLLDTCISMAPTLILTSPGNSPESSAGKHLWMNTKLKSRNWAISGAKWAFANSQSYLIDDRTKNVDRFIMAGGKAFLYSDSTFDSCVKDLERFINE